MKRFLIITSLTFCFYNIIFSQWRIIDTKIIDKLFIDICFTDTLNGWILCDKAIFKTQNGGETWIEQKMIDSASYNKIIFLDKDFGYVFGANGMMNTVDGGLNWEKQVIGNKHYYIGGMSFINDRTGWLVGNKVIEEDTFEIILKTSNRGIKWDTLLIRNNIIKFYDIKFIDSLNGYIIGSDGFDNFSLIYVYKSSDGGKIWSNYSIFSGAHTFYLYAKTLDTIWVAGIGFAKSFDGGKTWDANFKIEIEDSLLYGKPRFYDILQTSSKEGYAVIGTTKGPYQGKFNLHYTEDCGNYWSKVNIPFGFEPKSICEAGKYLFVVGRDGKIITNKPLFSNVNSDNSDLNFELFQNYPNPFNPSTTITYQLENEGRVKLIIYDVLGREIINSVDRIQKSGEHSVNWNGKTSTGEEANSGIYFYKLTFQNKSITKKAVLIH